MAWKELNPRDKGRCRRCELSSLQIEISPGKWKIIPKDTKRKKGRQQILYCDKYDKACCRVAWNCTMSVPYG